MTVPDPRHLTADETQAEILWRDVTRIRRVRAELDAFLQEFARHCDAVALRAPTLADDELADQLERVARDLIGLRFR